MRILRLISLIRGLRVLVRALMTTFLLSVIPFLIFLLIFLFVYAVFGYYLFGDRENGDTERWGSLGRCMLSLTTFVTVSYVLKLSSIELLTCFTFRYFFLVISLSHSLIYCPFIHLEPLCHLCIVHPMGFIYDILLVCGSASNLDPPL